MVAGEHSPPLGQQLSGPRRHGGCPAPWAERHPTIPVSPRAATTAFTVPALPSAATTGPGTTHYSRTGDYLLPYLPAFTLYLAVRDAAWTAVAGQWLDGLTCLQAPNLHHILIYTRS